MALPCFPSHRDLGASAARLPHAPETRPVSSAVRTGQDPQNPQLCLGFLTYFDIFMFILCDIMLHLFKKKTPSFSWTSNSSSPARATCLGPPTPHQHTSAISPTRLDIFKNKLCRNWNRFEQVLLLIHFVFSVYPRYTLDFRYPKVSSIIINYHQLSSIMHDNPLSKDVQSVFFSAR